MKKREITAGPRPRRNPYANCTYPMAVFLGGSAGVSWHPVFAAFMSSSTRKSLRVCRPPGRLHVFVDCLLPGCVCRHASLLDTIGIFFEYFLGCPLGGDRCVSALHLDTLNKQRAMLLVQSFMADRPEKMRPELISTQVRAGVCLYLQFAVCAPRVKRGLAAVLTSALLCVIV